MAISQKDITDLKERAIKTIPRSEKIVPEASQDPRNSNTRNTPSSRYPEIVKNISESTKNYWKNPQFKDAEDYAGVVVNDSVDGQNEISEFINYLSSPGDELRDINTMGNWAVLSSQESVSTTKESVVKLEEPKTQPPTPTPPTPTPPKLYSRRNESNQVTTPTFVSNTPIYASSSGGVGRRLLNFDRPSFQNIIIENIL